VRNFADPSVNFALEFAVPEPTPEEQQQPSRATGVPVPLAPAAPEQQPPSKPAEKTTAEVVTLDSFRKR
jgi:hypothetical protein